MTSTHAEPRAGARQAPTDEELAERFRPVFDRIAERAVEREAQRRLPYEEVEWLRAAGFGALRVPIELGGSGVSRRRSRWNGRGRTARTRPASSTSTAPR
ncbi:hypothetical protein GCM10010464_74900 [Pseudonocardia yunnanensis]|uniref:Acyl-CoA dehydrogenase/oxidase N-terminal domain-containing protein n=1 Tax=Pseudonocardia yunnanensis TaxID=58107 RepID=A0ABW4F4R3_9PSEU